MSSFYPGFDPSPLSDDELRDKITPLRERFLAAHAMGMSSDILNQLGRMIELIENEQYYRHMMNMQKAWDKQFPDVIETDPDTATSPAKKQSEDAAKQIKKERAANVPKFNKVYREK